MSTDPQEVNGLTHANNVETNGSIMSTKITTTTMHTSSSSSSNSNTTNRNGQVKANANGNESETLSATTRSKITSDDSSSSSSTTNTNTNTSTASPQTSRPTADAPGELKILGHLKNIEKVNEKRRIFLSNTLTGETTTHETALDTHSVTIESRQRRNGNDDESQPAANSLEEEETPDKTSLSVKYATLPKLTSVANTNGQATPLRSPLTPPPKPPMLSRTRSIGVGDNVTSPVTVAPAPLDAPSATHINDIMSVTAAAAASIFPIDAVVQMRTETTNGSVIANDERPISANAFVVSSNANTSSPDGAGGTSTTADKPKQQPISPKHYESLVEQLRCPGCASAMKAPILLCKSGHSICEQCTRILLMCPLCKETFTNTRCLTVEALCAKAHFRCSHAGGGCLVRMPIALLDWHEKQCVYKPMKCFMGRVWGDCHWYGREIQWKDHLESEHANKVFNAASADLIWNLGVKQKPLTGYYVFQTHDEMFNFYEIYDRERILFTMTYTSSYKQRKHNFAYEVTLVHPNNEALAITQKFPAHSEYDRDILKEGTCVSINMTDLQKFLDDEKLLHYRVNVLVVKSPRQTQLNATEASRKSFPLNYQNTAYAGGNVKSVSSNLIITRQFNNKSGNSNGNVNGNSNSNDNGNVSEAQSIADDGTNTSQRTTSNEGSEAEFNAYVERKWGTPQLHFNRKYLNAGNASTDGENDSLSPLRDDNAGRSELSDKVSLCSTNVSYTKRVSNTLRKSFRAFKTDLIELKPFSKSKSSSKSPEKVNGN